MRIATEIVTTKSLALRKTAIQFYIRCGKLLYLANNFEGLAMVMSALNQSSVSRLKKTWKAVDGKHLESFQWLDEFVGHGTNFGRYRKYLAQQYPNAIPWIGVLLRDFRFCYDGNPKMVAPGEYNYSLITLLGKQIVEVQEMQETRLECYSLNSAIRNALSDTTFRLLNSDELFAESISIEAFRNKSLMDAPLTSR